MPASQLSWNWQWFRQVLQVRCPSKNRNSTLNESERICGAGWEVQAVHKGVEIIFHEKSPNLPALAVPRKLCYSELPTLNSEIEYFFLLKNLKITWKNAQQLCHVKNVDVTFDLAFFMLFYKFSAKKIDFRNTEWIKNF